MRLRKQTTSVCCKNHKDTSLHTGQNGHHTQVNTQVLASLWRERNPSTLLVGIQNFLKKLKMEFPFDPAIPLLGLYPKNSETPIQKNPCTPVFIAVLFTIAKCWKQPKCPSVNEWIKKLIYLHNGTLCSRKKEGAPTLCDSMEGTGEHYAK